MPGASDGFKTAIIAMLGGLIISTAIGGLGTDIPNIQTWKALFDFSAILGVIITLENANYWGILYTLGYMAGIGILGEHLLPIWETQLLTLILGVYVVSKIWNKFS